MNPAPFIPPRTRAELSSPAPPGQRHEQMKKVVLPLLGAGLTPEAVFVQLRGMYEPDVNDREIRDLIEWAIMKNPQPCGYRSENCNFNATNFAAISDTARASHSRASDCQRQKMAGRFPLRRMRSVARLAVATTRRLARGCADGFRCPLRQR